MSDSKKGHLNMGLPRASGKRRWSGADMDDGVNQGPTKALCTSPPHAICAEDVLRIGGEKANHLKFEEMGAAQPEEQAAANVVEPEADTPIDTATTSVLNLDVESDVEDYMDDEEDKDSGFVDGNSAENSSDEESERTEDPSTVSFKHRFVEESAGPGVTYELSMTRSPEDVCGTGSTGSSCPHSMSPLPISTSPRVCSLECLSISSPKDVQSKTVISNAPSISDGCAYKDDGLTSEQEVSCPNLPPSCPESPISPTHANSPLSPQSEQPSSPPHGDSLSEFDMASTPHVEGMSYASESTEICSSGLRPMEYSDASMTTVLSAQTSTIVTSAYQGAVSSPAYDNPYPIPYSTTDLYQHRPGTPPIWSCNFYDGSHPTTTNKYMEISQPGQKPIVTSQSIQCDENGKSYLELGSASPYTPTYSNECGNFTTSPSSYPGQSYNNQTFTTSTNYNQPGSPYYNNSNTRQTYGPNPYTYSSPVATNEPYASYDPEGTTYNYSNYGTTGVRGVVGPRIPPRCASPYCDPTRMSPRTSCYQQQRLSVMNMSMLKLNKFSRFPELNLHRSVVICNTLRHIEKELESEGVSMASLIHSHQSHGSPIGLPPHVGPPHSGSNLCTEPVPSNTPPPPRLEGPLPSMHTPLGAGSLSLPPSVVIPMAQHPLQYPTTNSNSSMQYSSEPYITGEHPCTYADLEENRMIGPFTNELSANMEEDTTVETPVEDSELHEEVDQSPPVQRYNLPSPTDERTEGINWCSVLSLSSDLDSMNNNEYATEWSTAHQSLDLDYTTQREVTPAWKLPSLSADDVLKTFPEAPKRNEEENLTTIMNVLVDS